MKPHIGYLAHNLSYIEEIARLKYAQWLHTSPDRPYAVWVKETEESARIGTLPNTLIALDETTLLGFVTLIKIGEKSEVKDGVWMITLYVKTDQRRQGIGAQLIHHCIREVAQMDYHKLYLWTESNELTQYYTHLGWRQIAIDEESGEDIMEYEVINEK
jgi:N-acetylglutamate synthase-like GNAT family acetyltransferase